MTQNQDGRDGERRRGPRVVTYVHVTPAVLAEPAAAEPHAAADAATAADVAANEDADVASSECYLENGPSLAAESARRLCCDGHVARVVSGSAGEPLDLGRKVRTVSPALKRALILRDGCCRFPGCTRTHYLDAHHIQHWAHGGETHPENLILLCPQHHRTVHEGGVRIAREAGTVRFLRSDGAVMGAVRPPEIEVDASDWLREWCETEGLELTSKSLKTAWDGERWSPNDTVDWMLYWDGHSGSVGGSLGAAAGPPS